MPFLARPIPVKPFKTRSMNAYLLNALKASASDINADFQATVSTWTHSVGFSVKVMYKGADARILAWTGDYVWNLLNTGTHRRYARAAFGFTPKSRVRFIGAMPGSGMMIPSRIPLPGIKAREWTLVIREKNEKTFNQRIVAAIYRGFNG